MSEIELMALVASVTLPLWNIPLMVKIIKRKSSEDISLWWALGVWICILFMAPAGFSSKDIVWRSFNIVNSILFTGVVIVALKYRRTRKEVSDNH